MRLFWDTETALISPALQAPPITCLQAVEDGGEPFILQWWQVEAYMRARLEDPHTVFVGANVAFDFAVIAANFPDLIPLIFQAYDDDRVECTHIRQKLLDIACGVYRGYLNNKWQWVPFNYNLDSITRRHSEMRLNKDDAIRLTYGALRDVILSAWDEPHIRYALEDALATRECWLGQERQLAKNPHVPLLADQYRQTRADFALRLMSTWGLRTNQEAVDLLERLTHQRYDELEKTLIAEGLVKDNKVKSRDTKAAKARMLEVCGFEEAPSYDKKKKAYVFQPVAGAVQRKMHLTDGGDVSLSAESCKDSEDPLLELYGEFGELKSVLSKDVTALRQGIYWPIHSRFDLAASGRVTSSKPNVQNWRRLPGIREAFRPREGKIYLQADVEGLELCTLAQACIDILGYSKLAEAINAGLDAHTDLACSILCIPYAEGARRRKLASLPHVKQCLRFQQEHSGVKPVQGVHFPELSAEQWQDFFWYSAFDDARQAAKVANFGFPGGLGVKSMIAFAKATYGVIFDPDPIKAQAICAELKEKWLAKWPEMQAYFAYINSLVQQGDGEATVTQLRSGRIRGGCTYCGAANTFFQGLGADATKAALWEIQKECYVDRTSPLFGCRTVNYIHDEWIIECDDDDRAHDAAIRLEAIIVREVSKWVPNLRVAAPPLLMCYWSKSAKAVHNETTGRLIPWS